MNPVGAVRAKLARRDWPVASVPSGLLLYLLFVDGIVLVWAGYALANASSDARSAPTVGHPWWVLLLLVVLALAFEEGASRAARLQIRLSADLRLDMTSVWAVA